MDADQNYGKYALLLNDYITSHWYVGIILLVAIILLVFNFKDLMATSRKVRVTWLLLAFSLALLCYFFGYWNGYRFGATHSDHPYAGLLNG